MGASYFITKDSGKRATFDSGMQRDTEAGKPRFDLMLPLGVPFDEQMITRLAALFGRGSVKYDARNWEKADSQAEMERMKSSAFRHFMQWMVGETDEDHAAAVMFNIIAHESTAYKVAAGIVTVSIDPATGTASGEPSVRDDVDEWPTGPRGGDDRRPFYPGPDQPGSECDWNKDWTKCAYQRCRSSFHRDTA